MMKFKMTSPVRFLIVSLLAAGCMLPVAAAPDFKQQCKSRCYNDYENCLKRAAGKKARKTCTVSQRTCNHGCPAR